MYCTYGTVCTIKGCCCYSLLTNIVWALYVCVCVCLYVRLYVCTVYGAMYVCIWLVVELHLHNSLYQIKHTGCVSIGWIILQCVYVRMYVHCTVFMSCQICAWSYNIMCYTHCFLTDRFISCPILLSTCT